MTELFAVKTNQWNRIDALLFQIRQQEDLRKALSELRAAIKEEESYAYVRECLGSGDEVRRLLFAEDAKVRKNAAALLGDLQLEEAAADLYRAWQKEETLFVRGTMLGALEKTSPYPYLSELQEYYELLCEKEIPEDEKKHAREEIHVLERILRREGKENKIGRAHV